MSGYSRFAAFARLSGANVAAAVISVGGLAYIARLLNPSAFGQAAAVLLIGGIAATAVSGRYEVGAAVADHSEKGTQLSLRLARLALFLSLASALTLQLAVELAAGFVTVSEVSTWRWLPLLTLTTAATSVQVLLDTRTGRYGVLAWLIVARPMLLVIVVWVWATFVGPLGASALCCAYALSYSGSSVRAIWLVGRLQAPRWSPSQYVDLARKHSMWPRLQVPAALLNALSTSLLALTVGWTFGPAALGAFTLATRLTGLPVTIAGGPINTLYLRESVLARRDPLLARRYFLHAVAGSTAVGMLAAPPLVLGAPHLDVVLGAEWALVEGYVLTSLPLMWAMLVSAPVNSALTAYKRQRALLGWRIILVACPAVGLVLAGTMSSGAEVGIAVGSGVALILAVAFVFFGLRTISPAYSPEHGREQSGAWPED